MPVFALVAAVLVVVALAFLLPPLLRRAPTAGVSTDAANISVYRDQLAELEADVRRGVITEAQSAQARAEIERRLADDLGTSSQAAPAARPSRVVAIVIAAAVPLIAVAGYALLGKPEALDPEKRLGMTVEQAAARTKMQEMTAKLAARAKEKPEDPIGWAMLGRAYRMLGKLPEAARAYGKSVQLKSDDPEILVEYAESLGMAQNGRFDGEPLAMAKRALALDPKSEKALALLGTVAFEAGDFKSAVEYWERLLALADPGTDFAKAVEGGLAEARAGLEAAKSAPASRITGKVSIEASLAASAPPDAVVFVFARAAQGPRMPLAVQRMRVKDLPADFALDDSLAMAPGMKISAFDSVVIGARVSISGSATPQPGDLEGTTAAVKPGAGGLKLVIDRKTP
jgi:cytochrome c-type biogenesis protein CcmH